MVASFKMYHHIMVRCGVVSAIFDALHGAMINKKSFSVLKRQAYEWCSLPVEMGEDLQGMGLKSFDSAMDQMEKAISVWEALPAEFGKIETHAYALTPPYIALDDKTWANYLQAWRTAIREKRDEQKAKQSRQMQNSNRNARRMFRLKQRNPNYKSLLD
jgi:hypothetical protein